MGMIKPSLEVEGIYMSKVEKKQNRNLVDDFGWRIAA